MKVSRRRRRARLCKAIHRVFENAASSEGIQGSRATRLKINDNDKLNSRNSLKSIGRARFANIKTLTHIVDRKGLHDIENASFPLLCARERKVNRLFLHIK